MNRSKKSSGKQQSDTDSDFIKWLHPLVASSRETVESIAVAVILAFMFRAFVAEAFVIPTGSMAPTLQGRHRDVFCSECGHNYRAGASQELDQGRLVRSVAATSCPICGNTQTLKPSTNANEFSFDGDRIIVNKFIYDLKDPVRWDVIVFKYPGNAVQNYIKRLIGLPNEEILIFQGDIYIKKPGEQDYTIARKPPAKLKSMLQLVDDTNHIPQALNDVAWPLRWQPNDDAGWKITNDTTPVYQLSRTDQESLVRYYHRVPSYQRGIDEWVTVRNGTLPATVSKRDATLISDFCVYNYGQLTPIQADWSTGKINYHPGQDREYDPASWGNMGSNWVGDLAVEAELQIDSDTGELVLDLVEAGVHFQCRIDVATGEAKLQLLNADFSWDAESAPKATTRVRGRGRHRIRFANCDDQISLWIDGSYIEFDNPATFRVVNSAIEPRRPSWSPSDPGDYAPIGIGGKSLDLKITRLRVLRDIYYIAMSGTSDRDTDYVGAGPRRIRELFQTPSEWATCREFSVLRSASFQLGPDQYLPLGDNSPASKDARIWSVGPLHRAEGPFVKRELMLGKAVLIYWPHSWNRPIPYLTPNVARMGLIR